MSDHKETPERRRERMRQKELKNNPSGSIHGSGLPDLVGGMSWKSVGSLLLILIIAFIVYVLFFN